jgi:enoyl-CoA hydratase
VEPFETFDGAGRVAVDVTPAAVVVSFIRPEKRNAIDPAASAAIADALDRAVAVPRPVVFRSATRGMFVAGTDLDGLRRRTVEDSLDRLNGRLFQRVAEHPWPTVAVVEGWALGGGCELALACDLRVSTSDASWGLPEVRLGLVPSAGGMTRLAALVGTGAATDLILSGRRIDGVEAHRLGLVQRLAAADDLDATLDRVLDDLGRAAPLAQRLAKEAMRVVGDRHRLVDATAQALCIASDDAQQRIARQLGETTG